MVIRPPGLGRCQAGHPAPAPAKPASPRAGLCLPLRATRPFGIVNSQPFFVDNLEALKRGRTRPTWHALYLRMAILTKLLIYGWRRGLRGAILTAVPVRKEQFNACPSRSYSAGHCVCRGRLDWGRLGPGDARICGSDGVARNGPGFQR